jgi:hypothetical protein
MAVLARPMQFHRVEPHLNAMGLRMFGNSAIGWKQGELRVAEGNLIEGLNLTTPSFMRLSLISPRYSTWRCTTLPPAQRLFSTIFQ